MKAEVRRLSESGSGMGILPMVPMVHRQDADVIWRDFLKSIGLFQGRFIFTVLVLGMLAWLPQARADFAKFDDFETYEPGDINGRGNWVTNRSTAAVVTADPTRPDNNVLHHFDYLGTAYNPNANIAQGTTATLFLRFYYDSTNNDTVFGLSDVTAPNLYINTFGDFEAQVGLYNSSTLRLRDGYWGTTPTGDSFGPDSAGLEVATHAMNPGAWYNFWMVVDNSADTIRLFMQSDDDLDFAQQTEFFSRDGTISFRNGVASNDLPSILIRTYTYSLYPSVYFDDFYIDRSGVNLANPIPEPAISTLALLAALGLLGRRVIAPRKGSGKE